MPERDLDGTPYPERPTVKIFRPREGSAGYGAEVLLYIEGRAGQRVRIYVSPSTDIMRLFVEHDDITVVETTETRTVRWHDAPAGSR